MSGLAFAFFRKLLAVFMRDDLKGFRSFPSPNFRVGYIGPKVETSSANTLDEDLRWLELEAAHSGSAFARNGTNQGRLGVCPLNSPDKLFREGMSSESLLTP